MKSTLVLFAVLALGAPVAQADDATARDLFAKAKALFDKRGDKLQNSIDAAGLLDKAEAETGRQAAGRKGDPELKYDILVLNARALYWQGCHTDGDDNKKVIHLKARDKAVAATLIADEYSEGHYFAGINLARWAEANGIVSSISHKGELVEFMNKAADISRTTRDGRDGATVDGNGPDRVLGRMYHKLPGILGGDHNLAVTYLRTAVAKTQGHAINTVYLADALLKGNNTEKAEGKKILNDLLVNKPEEYGAASERVPETMDEFGWARDLLNGKPIP